MDRNNFYRFLLLAFYVFYGSMLFSGLILPSDYFMTWDGPRDKLNTILGFTIVNLLILTIIIAGEYRYKRSIERDEKTLTVFFGSFTLLFEVLREDYIPTVYLFVLTISAVTFFIYLHFYLATIFNWDITYMRTPGAPPRWDAIIPIGPMFAVVIISMYKFYKWNQKAVKLKKEQ